MNLAQIQGATASAQDWACASFVSINVLSRALSCGYQLFLPAYFKFQRYSYNVS